MVAEKSRKDDSPEPSGVRGWTTGHEPVGARKDIGCLSDKQVGGREVVRRVTPTTPVVFT